MSSIDLWRRPTSTGGTEDNRDNSYSDAFQNLHPAAMGLRQFQREEDVADATIRSWRGASATLVALHGGERRRLRLV